MAVPLPPVPADPNTCRWCLRTRITLSTGDVICESGCAANDSAPHAGWCQDCRQAFMTGRSDVRDQCWRCMARELRQYYAIYDDAAQTSRYELRKARETVMHDAIEKGLR